MQDHNPSPSETSPPNQGGVFARCHTTDKLSTTFRDRLEPFTAGNVNERPTLPAHLSREERLLVRVQRQELTIGQASEEVRRSV